MLRRVAGESPRTLFWWMNPELTGWLRGQVPDALMLKWAGSSDRWWRRAALVSTVADRYTQLVNTYQAMGGGWVDIANSLTPQPQGVAAARAP